jgi:cyanophycinase
VQLGDLVDALAELSQLLTQAIVMPIRRRLPERRRPAQGPWASRVRGTLVAASGTVGDELVLEMIHRGGGRRARAVVLPAAHVDFQRAGERYIRYFTRFGMQRVEALPLAAREQANDREIVERIAAADIVFLAGGDAGLLLDVLVGTASQAALWDALRRGAVVAAAGGAAGAIGTWSVRWGEEPPRSEPSGVGVEGGPSRPGLGLLPGCLLDRQGVQRGRLGRFLHAVAATPGVSWGIGLDEGAALVVSPGWQLAVHGSGPVLCVEPRLGRTPAGAAEANGAAAHPPVAPAAAARPAVRAPNATRPTLPVPASPPDGQPPRDPTTQLALSGASVHVLPPGWRLDLRLHQILPPATAAASPVRGRRR